MRRAFVPAVMAAFLATAPLAFASQTVDGTVKMVDKTAMTLTLDNGTIYHLPKGWKDPGLKSGEKVAVTFDQKDGGRIASKVIIVN